MHLMTPKVDWLQRQWIDHRALQILLEYYWHNWVEFHNTNGYLQSISMDEQSVLHWQQ